MLLFGINVRSRLFAIRELALSLYILIIYLLPLPPDAFIAPSLFFLRLFRPIRLVLHVPRWLVLFSSKYYFPRFVLPCFSSFMIVWFSSFSSPGPSIPYAAESSFYCFSNYSLVQFFLQLFYLFTYSFLLLISIYLYNIYIYLFLRNIYEVFFPN